MIEEQKERKRSRWGCIRIDKEGNEKSFSAVNVKEIKSVCVCARVCGGWPKAHKMCCIACNDTVYL